MEVKSIVMDKETVKKLKEFVLKVEKVNNQTENKIDILKTVLIEYDEFSKLYNDFRSFPISEMIGQITSAKTKRKNVSKEYLHKEFVRIKKESLFRIKYNHRLVNFKIEDKKNT